MPGSRRTTTILVAVVLLAGAAPAAAAAPPDDDPAAWPASDGVDPDLEAAAHGVRVSGPDRYQTALATSLVLRGRGDFPFDTADRTGEGDWWGARACPYAVVVTAGDDFADSLAAASLSDPTDRSDEPRLERVAAADPLFHPVGGFARVDTEAAPVLVTPSARSGAGALGPSARTAARDLAAGGCTTARAAVVVGGAAAVPVAAEAELLALGYAEVFRVAGTDRYDTARLVALALGTGDPPADAACADPDATDGAHAAFYANAAVEHRPTANECRVLGRTVALADGLSGADALAAGWWTSFWQVPVLLAGPGGALPEPTRDALRTLDVDHVVVLGGPARVPPAVVDEAAALATAPTLRVAGADRYDTSAQAARLLGGWYPADPGGYARSLVCLAASGGEGPGARGWPDALGAGPWCGAANGAAGRTRAPERAPAPEGTVLRGAEEARPGHDVAPVLLVAPGAPALPAPVAALLAGAFDPDQAWCASAAIPGGGGSSDAAACAEPGFAVAFGGPALVSEAAFLEAARLVSGGTYGAPEDRSPVLGPGFSTELDLSPVFGSGGGDGARQACFLRGALSGVRWLAAYDDPARTAFGAAYDLAAAGAYAADADGGRSPGVARPTCLRLAARQDAGAASVSGVSASGHVTEPLALAGPERRFALSGDVVQARPERFVTALPSVGGRSTSWRFSGGLEGSPTATSQGSAALVEGATLDVTVDHGEGEAPHRFAGTARLVTASGRVEVLLSGEAVLDPGVWRLRGRATFAGGSWNASRGLGGFRADVATAGSDAGGDDVVAWRFDGSLA